MHLSCLLLNGELKVSFDTNSPSLSISPIPVNFIIPLHKVEIYYITMKMSFGHEGY